MASTALATALGSAGGAQPAQKNAALQRQKNAMAELKDRFLARTKASNLRVRETVNAVVGIAEVQGSAAAASLASGYFGPDKLKVGGVDVRGVSALALLGLGIKDTMEGKDGSHLINLGNGVGVSYVCEVAYGAGRKMATPKAGTGTAGAAGRGPVREVRATPSVRAV